MVIVTNLLYYQELQVSLRFILDSEPIAKIGRSKTMTKKEKRRSGIPKADTDAVLITPSQFIMENQGILNDCYKFEKQLGEGKVQGNE